jgi:hypothetical protein
VRVIETIGQGVCVILVNHGELRVAAVVVPPGEARVHAQIFVASFAITAETARRSEPRNSDPIAELESGGTRPDFIDDSYNFVAGNHIWPVRFQIALGDVQVGSTYSARGHTHAHLLDAWARRFAPYEMEGTLIDRARLSDLPRAHAHAG